MRFAFEGARLERGEARWSYDLLLGVIATFEVRVGDRLLYREEMFPIVELCVALRQWRRDSLPRRQAFVFQSLESDEAGLVWIRPDDGGWRVGSIHQEYPELRRWSDDEIGRSLNDFVRSVDDWLSENTGSSVDDLR